MNAQRVERGIHVFSVIAIWMAFLMGWGFKVRQMEPLAALGSDLPAPTLLWLGFADSWVALAFPAICTVLIVWLMRSRSAHVNWVASSMLIVGLLYGVIAQTALILPTFKMCGAV